MAAILTGDAEIAQGYAVSREVEGSLPPIFGVLQGVDASFRPVPHGSRSTASSAFQNADGYRVKFLTSNCCSDDYIEPAGEDVRPRRCQRGSPSLSRLAHQGTGQDDATPSKRCSGGRP